MERCSQCGTEVNLLGRDIAGEFHPGKGCKAHEANARPMSAAQELLVAAKYCGGGDMFIEDYGRTCHCPYHTRKGGVTRDGMMNAANHATSCNEMWNAIAKAEGRVS
jgi:hypothetical protein